jgi:hypothetical protein
MDARIGGPRLTRPIVPVPVVSRRMPLPGRALIVPALPAMPALTTEGQYATAGNGECESHDNAKAPDTSDHVQFSLHCDNLAAGESTPADKALLTLWGSDGGKGR